MKKNTHIEKYGTLNQIFLFFLGGWGGEKKSSHCSNSPFPQVGALDISKRMSGLDFSSSGVVSHQHNLHALLIPKQTNYVRADALQGSPAVLLR